MLFCFSSHFSVAFNPFPAIDVLLFAEVQPTRTFLFPQVASPVVWFKKVSLSRSSHDILHIGRICFVKDIV